MTLESRLIVPNALQSDVVRTEHDATDEMFEEAEDEEEMSSRV